MKEGAQQVKRRLVAERGELFQRIDAIDQRAERPQKEKKESGVKVWGSDRDSEIIRERSSHLVNRGGGMGINRANRGKAILSTSMRKNTA